MISTNLLEHFTLKAFFSKFEGNKTQNRKDELQKDNAMNSFAPFDVVHQSDVFWSYEDSLIQNDLSVDVFSSFDVVDDSDMFCASGDSQIKDDSFVFFFAPYDVVDDTDIFYKFEEMLCTDVENIAELNRFLSFQTTT
jgi:1,4-dihydroxy-2-naphthoyl-CoA synthase